MNFYTDNDPKVCAWSEMLVYHGLIAPGRVLCKPIQELKADELTGYTQCHFFNGISGWSNALDLAGWPRNRSVWSASLPCQSFSAASKGKGFKDDRGNLWFPFLRLVRECRPLCIFGEQVDKAIGHGWLDRIFSDLEEEGYTCGATVLGAHSAGAPHIRQRIFWVAYTKCSERWPSTIGRGDNQWETGEWSQSAEGTGECGETIGLAFPGQQQARRGLQESREGAGTHQGRSSGKSGGSSDSGGLEHSTGERTRHEGLPELGRSGPWDDYEWIACADGKQRRIESGTAPLASGVPARVVRLRGYGNSLVSATAAHFIQASVEAINQLRA